MSKNFRNFLSMLAFTLVFATSYGHDFYFSFSNIVVNAESNTAQVIINLEGHDVEKALGENFHHKFNLDDSEDDSNNKFLKKYINQNFNLFCNGVKLKSNWIGYEMHVTDELEVYLEFDLPKVMHNLTCFNSILIDTFPDQENKILIEKDSFKKSFITYKSNLKQSVKFIQNP